jgi:hypothetical protein
MADIGRPREEHLRYAQHLVASLPVELHQAADEPYGARAVVCALLAGPQAVRRQALARLERTADPALVRETHRLLPHVQSLDARQRLPLLDLALPALRSLSASQWTAFRPVVDALIQADETVDLFEWSLRRVLHRHVARQHDRAAPPRTLRLTRAQRDERAAVLLSALARAGSQDATSAARAVAAGAAALGAAGITVLPAEACGVAALDRALDGLGHLPPLPRREVVAACAACVCADREVTATEAELLRAVCDGLLTPMPPLLDARTAP